MSWGKSTVRVLRWSEVFEHCVQTGPEWVTRTSSGSLPNTHSINLSATNSSLSRRMLKMTNLLTRPTPSRQDAPFRGQGRREQLRIVLPSLLVLFLGMEAD
jgi:hypothetical protein